MKTGTPPRVDGRSLDYSKMIEQPGDIKPSKFSYSNSTKPLTKQRSCYITHTNIEVHDILREDLIDLQCSTEQFKAQDQDTALL